MFERLKTQTSWPNSAPVQNPNILELAPLPLSQLIIEQVSDAVFIVDPDGTIVDANPAACRMLKYRLDELRGLHGLELSSDREATLQVIERQIAQHESALPPQPERVSLVCRDGSTIIVETVSHPLLDQDAEVIGYVTFNRDVTQEDAQSSEIELLTNIIEQSDTAVVAVKVEGDQARVVYVNPAVNDLFQGNPRSLLGQKVPLLSGETALDEESRETYARCRRDGTAGRAFSVLVKPDGAERIIDVQFSPIRDKKGDISHWVGLNTDVTEQFERDQRQKVIERSLENLDVGYNITRSDNLVGLVEYANPAWEKITGFDREAIIGQRLPKVIVEDPINTVTSRDIVRAFDNGQPLSGVTRAKRADGSSFIREFDLGPVADSNGKTTHWYFLTKDITEQVEQSEQVRLLSSTVDQSLTATVIATVGQADTKVVYVNASWERMFGISAQEALDRPWQESQIAKPIDAESLQSFVAAAQRGTPGEGHMAFTDQAGVERTIHVVLNPIKDEHEVVTHWVGMCTDVTEQMAHQDEIKRLNNELETRVEKRTAQLRGANESLRQTLTDLRTTQDKLVEAEKYASLGNLVAGVAHEINTPVGIAVTAASMISEQLASLQTKYTRGKLSVEDLEAFLAQQQEAEAILKSNLSRASDLISSFKQVAVDQSCDNLRVIELYDYLTEILTSLRPQLKKKQIATQVTCPEDLTVLTNPGALSQVITNLAMNSAIHAYDGTAGALIELSVTQDADSVHISYRDFGRGMTQEQQDRVFEPFYTTKRGAGGSGLGMNIVYNLVSRTLKGHIKVSSTEGAGACFDISIPRDLTPQDTAPSSPVN